MEQFNKIVWLDAETTGTNVNEDRIVQIALFTTDMQFNITSEVFETLINPTVPIPADSTEVHGITDEMVASQRTFTEIASGLLGFMKDAHIGGYNVRFDIQLLMAEFERCGLELNMTGRMIIDPYVVDIKMRPRDQKSVYKFMTGKELEDAHSAKADILATHEIAIEQLKMWSDVKSAEDMYALSEPENTCDMAGKFKMKNGVPVFAFGKHIGKSVSEQKPYLKWMEGGDFPTDTKNWIRKYLEENGK